MSTDIECPYCSADRQKPLNVETIKYSLIELMLVGGRSSVLRARHFPSETSSLYDNQECVLINYCPMCGRYLHNE